MQTSLRSALVPTLLCASIICGIGCSSKSVTEKPVNQDTVVSEVDAPLLPVADFDPYFIESDVVESKSGPTSITRTICEDSKGNIWLATWQGVMLYDGTTFTNITKTDSLRPWHVFSAMEDHDGNMWFGTVGAGVYRFDGTRWTNFTAHHGIGNDRSANVWLDNNGTVWVGSEGGLSRFDGKRFQNFTPDDGLDNIDVHALLHDSNGRYWIGTRGKASWYDGKSFTDITTETGQTFTNLRTVIEAADGSIWLGSDNGLWRFKDGAFTQFHNEFVGYVFQDSKGNFWTSQERGGTSSWNLCTFSIQGDSLVNFREESPKLPMLFGIEEDRNGHLWVGLLDGVCRYDGSEFDYFR